MGKFTIEPAQTYWNAIDSDDRNVLECRFSTPKGTDVLGIDQNNVLCRVPHGVEERDPIVLFAIRVGVVVDESLFERGLRYIGRLLMGSGLDCYCVFLKVVKD